MRMKTSRKETRDFDSKQPGMIQVLDLRMQWCTAWFKDKAKLCTYVEDRWFEIEDSGKGIDESMIENIWKGFSTKGELHCGYIHFSLKILWN